MITPLLAAKAYAAAAQTPSLGKATGAAAEGQGPDFGSMLKNVLNDTVHATKAAEHQIAAGAQGKAEMIDVVTAISSAESSLETVMAVRDQVIAAYQEIMRMPI
jgi:flagellar hook-basal body complex protein FliE